LQRENTRLQRPFGHFTLTIATIDQVGGFTAGIRKSGWELHSRRMPIAVNKPALTSKQCCRTLGKAAGYRI
jgi:hypothetical protein